MAAITASQCYRFKLLHILETAGQEVLTYTLLSGMPGKAPTQTLEDYLIGLPPDSTANYTGVKDKAKCFNATDRMQITRDLSCTTFDITLLHKAIRLACEGVAGNNDSKWTSAAPHPWQLEYYVTKIKNIRNETVHEHNPLDEQAFLNTVAELSHLFVTTLKATRDRYGRDNTEYLAKKDSVLDTVKDIREENLGEQEILQRSATNMLPLLKTETVRELRKRLNSAQYIQPLHFLSVPQSQRVEVNQMFCDIILTKKTPQGRTDNVSYLKVLELCERGGPHVLVVEGEAGSGKTTLATFLLAQWLKPQSDRRMEGLQHYDQLLWVVCRDQSRTSLKDLLEVLLPESYIRYGHLLLPLLRQCRVLVLVDGLDERNDVTRQLVEDILGEAATTTFTILCTSRPQSVQDVKNMAQEAHFQVCHVHLKGITPSMRMELVLKHYSWLTGRANITLDSDAEDSLQWQIYSSELFGLPLNLLFLATFFFYTPDGLSATITQPKLYHFIHEWCKEKLQDRLATSSQVGGARVFHQGAVETVLRVMYSELFWLPLNLLFLTTFFFYNSDALFAFITQSKPYRIIHEWCKQKDRLATPSQTRGVRVFRQGAIERVLRVIYEMSLKGLLQGRLYLSDEDLMAVQDACTREHLEPGEVLPAFYCLRREESFGVVTEYFCPPHKSLQEFYAAKHITGQLSQYTEGAIERVVQACMLGQEPDFGQLRNMLHHLLGLLTQQTGTVTPALEETVDLLQRSGVLGINDWLHILADTEAPVAIVQRVSQIPEVIHDERIVEVTDGTVTVASLLLQHLSKRRVDIELTQELASMEDLVQGLKGHKVCRVYLHHHFRHPQQHTTSAPLLHCVSRSDYGEFEGHLDSEDLLFPPRHLLSLHLVIEDSDHAHRLLPALAEALPSLQHLEVFMLHVPVAAVNPSTLTPLPAINGVISLCLSGVTEELMEVACKTVEILCPKQSQGGRHKKRRYRSQGGKHKKRRLCDLRFPGATLNVQGWQDLLRMLQEAGVTMEEEGRVWIPDTHISEEEQEQLRALTTWRLCRKRECDLWYFLP